MRDDDTDQFGLEGFINTTVANGPPVKFFDPLYALNKAKYSVQSEHDFTFAGISLNLKLATPERLRITNPETVASMREAERAAAGHCMVPIDYVEVDASRTRSWCKPYPMLRITISFRDR